MYAVLPISPPYDFNTRSDRVRNLFLILDWMEYEARTLQIFRWLPTFFVTLLRLVVLGGLRLIRGTRYPPFDF